MPGTRHFPGLDWVFAARDPFALAEAMGHAWVQTRAGGSVTLVDADLTHPWWPMLRGWLPASAPLWLVSSSTVATGSGPAAPGPVEALPQRPFPPVQLASLQRSGAAPWMVDLTPVQALDWLAEREPLLLLPHCTVHPALLIAHAAIASWGWRVVWPVPGLEPDWAEALAYIGRRQLPLQLLLGRQPSGEVPLGWWPVPASSAALWLQHEWPTLYLPA